MVVKIVEILIDRWDHFSSNSERVEHDSGIAVLFLAVLQVARLSKISAYTEPETPADMEHDAPSYSRRLKFTSLDSTDEEKEANNSILSEKNKTTPEPMPAPTSGPNKYAVVNLMADKSFYLWGIYSLHVQIKKFGMLPKIRHVVLVGSDMKKKHKDLLRKWLGKEQVIVVDKNHIRDKVPGGVWSTVFSKIEFFNLTQYDKVIGLDNDVFLRQNIAQWFDYPAPAATQARGTIEWNSGAMVIEPNEELYNTLLKYIPKTKVWNSQQDEGVDGFNSGHGHQGFLSSFFLSDVTEHTIQTMSYGASVLNSDLKRVRNNDYF